MTDEEVDRAVIEVVRQFTQNESASPASRFDTGLRLSETGRQMLFASLATAFAARGVSLASRGFMLSDFLACPTPGAVREAIRVRVFGAPAPQVARAAGEPVGQPAVKATPVGKIPSGAKAKVKTGPKRAPAQKKARSAPQAGRLPGAGKKRLPKKK